VIEGPPHKVARPSNAASAAVLGRCTSTRSRPSAHLTDEAEEVDRCVVLEAPVRLKLSDGILYATQFAGHRVESAQGG